MADAPERRPDVVVRFNPSPQDCFHFGFSGHTRSAQCWAVFSKEFSIGFLGLYLALPMFLVGLF